MTPGSAGGMTVPDVGSGALLGSVWGNEKCKVSPDPTVHSKISPVFSMENNFPLALHTSHTPGFSLPPVMPARSGRNSRNSLSGILAAKWRSTAATAPASAVTIGRFAHAAKSRGVKTRTFVFISPNVKDEPRLRPAGRLLRSRHDGRGRWLWRLVGLLFCSQDQRHSGEECSWNTEHDEFGDHADHE